jgi:hypothetical protein
MTDDEMTQAEQAGRRQARSQYIGDRGEDNPFSPTSIQRIGFELEMDVIRMEEDMSSTFGGEP